MCLARAGELEGGDRYLFSDTRHTHSRTARYFYKKTAGFTGSCGFYYIDIRRVGRVSLKGPRDQSHGNRLCVRNKHALELQV